MGGTERGRGRDCALNAESLMILMKVGIQWQAVCLLARQFVRPLAQCILPGSREHTRARLNFNNVCFIYIPANGTRESGLPGTALKRGRCARARRPPAVLLIITRLLCARRWPTMVSRGIQQFGMIRTIFRTEHARTGQAQISSRKN